MKEAIYVKMQRHSLNRGGGLRHRLSSIYNAVVKSCPRHFKPPKKLASYDHNNSNDARVGKLLANESYIESFDHNISHEHGRAGHR